MCPSDPVPGGGNLVVCSVSLLCNLSTYVLRGPVSCTANSSTDLAAQLHACCFAFLIILFAGTLLARRRAPLRVSAGSWTMGTPERRPRSLRETRRRHGASKGGREDERGGGAPQGPVRTGEPGLRHPTEAPLSRLPMPTPSLRTSLSWPKAA